MIKCIAIDDEPLALRQIRNYIGRTSELELAAAFADAIAAREYLENEEVDLIFVDINMPDLNGLDFVRTLARKTMVVFTTAYSEHAVEGFRLDAVDYLLKPFSFEEFRRTVDKVCSLCELVRLARQAETEGTAAEATPESPEYISVKADYKVSLIRIADIVYVESEGEYVRLHLADGSTVMTLFRLKNMESALPAESFMRVHRSFVVNLKYITGYAKGRVYVGENDCLPIGDNYRQSFQQYVDRHFPAIG